MGKLRLNSDNEIGMDIENIKNWAEYFAELQDKIHLNKPLDDDDKLYLQLLLHKVSNKMKEKPEYFLISEKVGRPLVYATETIQKEILKAIYFKRFTKIKDAIEYVAQNNHKSYETIRSASKGMTNNPQVKKALEFNKKRGNN